MENVYQEIIKIYVEIKQIGNALFQLRQKYPKLMSGEVDNNQILQTFFNLNRVMRDHYTNIATKFIPQFKKHLKELQDILNNHKQELSIPQNQQIKSQNEAQNKLKEIISEQKQQNKIFQEEEFNFAELYLKQKIMENNQNKKKSDQKMFTQIQQRFIKEKIGQIKRRYISPPSNYKEQVQSRLQNIMYGDDLHNFLQMYQAYRKIQELNDANDANANELSSIQQQRQRCPNSNQQLQQRTEQKQQSYQQQSSIANVANVSLRYQKVDRSSKLVNYLEPYGQLKQLSNQKLTQTRCQRLILIHAVVMKSLLKRMQYFVPVGYLSPIIKRISKDLAFSVSGNEFSQVNKRFQRNCKSIKTKMDQLRDMLNNKNKIYKILNTAGPINIKLK